MESGSAARRACARLRDGVTKNLSEMFESREEAAGELAEAAEALRAHLRSITGHTAAALEAGRLVLAAVDGATVQHACALSRMLLELPPALESSTGLDEKSLVLSALLEQLLLDMMTRGAEYVSLQQGHAAAAAGPRQPPEGAAVRIENSYDAFIEKTGLSYITVSVYHIILLI
jgi:hypothetical protein